MTGCEGEDPVAPTESVEEGEVEQGVQQQQPQQHLKLAMEGLAGNSINCARAFQPPSCAGLCTSARILPVRLDLIDLTYSVSKAGVQADSSSSSTPILSSVSASLRAGQLVAIMGPSGSGKSSLLSLLHGERRYLQGVTGGELLVNGTPLKDAVMQRHFRDLCSLVPQEDVLLSSFTVRETLMFSAHLRLPTTKTLAQKTDIVNEVISDLSLSDCADTLISGQQQGGGRGAGPLLSLLQGQVGQATGQQQQRQGGGGGGISGGQRRRVSIGLEMVVNPSVLLLDEPTSGLDSKTAEDICLLLWMLAKPGRIVACSIHQPSYAIFSRFDRLCFLVRGHVVYLGSGEGVMGYFSSMGFSVPPFENPSDYYMRVMQSEHSATLVSSWAQRRHKQLEEGGKEVEVERDPEASWLRRGEAATRSRRQGEGSVLGEARRQYVLLVRRMLEDSVRDRAKFLSGVAMETMVGLLVGIVWLRQDVHSEASIFPVLGVFIMLTTIAIFDSMVGVCLRFPLSRALHLREFSNGYYWLSPFYLACVSSSLLLSAAYQLAQALLVFFMVGLDLTASKLAMYLLILSLASSLGACLGLLVGTRTSDLKAAQQALTPILSFLMLFAGYMQPYPMLPVYLRWAYHVSPYQHVFSALAVNHFHTVVFKDCHFPSPAANNRRLCFPDGDTYLRVAMGLDPAHALARSLAVMLAMLVALIVVGFHNLRRVSQ